MEVHLTVSKTIPNFFGIVLEIAWETFKTNFKGVPYEVTWKSPKKLFGRNFRRKYPRHSQNIFEEVFEDYTYRIAIGIQEIVCSNCRASNSDEIFFNETPEEKLYEIC